VSSQSEIPGAPTVEDLDWAREQMAPGLSPALRESAIRAAAAVRARQRLGERGALLPAMRARPSPALGFVTARTLAERGFWSLTPSAHLSLLEWDDLSGTLEVHPSAGLSPPGVFEALVMGILVSRWCHGPRDVADPQIEISATGIAHALGIGDDGKNLARIVSAVESLCLTRYRYVEQSSEGGYSNLFSLLDEVETRWKGPVTSPRRRLRAKLSATVMEAVSDRRMVRPVDVAVLRRLGEQRELARRLFLFLESRPGHREGPYDRIEHLIDARLGHTLGTRLALPDLRKKLRPAVRAIEQATSARYRIEIVPRQKSSLSPGDPRYLLSALRCRQARVRAG
jgi:hypothetical protein